MSRLKLAFKISEMSCFDVRKSVVLDHLYNDGKRVNPEHIICYVVGATSIAYGIDVWSEFVFGSLSCGKPVSRPCASVCDWLKIQGRSV